MVRNILAEKTLASMPEESHLLDPAPTTVPPLQHCAGSGFLLLTYLAFDRRGEVVPHIFSILLYAIGQ